MRPELIAIAGGQGGVFLRRQAVQAGYSDTEIACLVRRKEWTRLRRGAFCETALAADCGVPELHLLVARAAVMVAEPPAYLSHDSAVAALRLPAWGLRFDRVHLTRTAEHTGRLVAGVNHHEARLPPGSMVQVDGLPVTSLERTALDVAREYGYQQGVVTADAALRDGADQQLMREWTESMEDWPASREMKAVVAFADRGAQSPGESLTRIAVAEAGLPAPQSQFEVRDGGFVAFVDLVVPELMLALEFDGRMKYRRTRDSSDPVIDVGDIVWAEKQREDHIRELGYDMIRIIWADLFGARRTILLRRLRAADERARQRRVAVV